MRPKRARPTAARFWQAVACGEYGSVEEAAEKLIKVVDTIEPDAGLVSKYDERYEKFVKIYPAVRELYQELK